MRLTTWIARLVLVLAVGAASQGIAWGFQEDPRRANGSRTWLVMLCNFPDRPVNQEPDYYVDLFDHEYPGLGHYWDAVSYGRLQLQAEVVGWYTLPHSYDYYMKTPDYDQGSGRPNVTALVHDCQEAVDPAVFFPEYDGLAHFFGGEFPTNRAYGGLASFTEDVDGYRWRPGVTVSDPATWHDEHGNHPEAIVAHEMGHGFGFSHSHIFDEEYGSDWDLMSNIAPDCDLTSGPCEPVEPIAYWKRRAGWLTDEEVATQGDDTTTTHLLRPLSLDHVDGTHRMIELPVRGRETRFITVEARVREGYDVLLPDDGVLIHKITDTPGTFSAQLVNLSEGAWHESQIWQPGETFDDDESGISISVEGVDEAGNFEVTVVTPAQNGRGYPREIRLKTRGRVPYDVQMIARIVAPGTPDECRFGARVLLQRQGGAGWRTVKRFGTALAQPSNRTYIRDARHGRFRVVAPARSIGWDVCERAISETVAI